MLDFKNSIIVGAGIAGLAAGYWFKRQNPHQGVQILEKEPRILPWIGRNIERPLILGSTIVSTADEQAYYPKGNPELLRILEKWPGASTRDWLSSLGLVIEETPEGTFFLDKPGALSDVLGKAIAELGIEVVTGFAVEAISAQTEGGYRVWSKQGDALTGESILIATGGERNHGLKLSSELGARTSNPFPAFVRLRLASPKLGERLGPIRRHVKLRCLKSGDVSGGELFLSARGMEGPALSRLSSRQCDVWNQLGYRLRVEVDWLPDLNGSSVRNQLVSRCERGGRRLIGTDALFGFTGKQWRTFLKQVRIEEDLPWARLKVKKVQALSQRLKADVINVSGMGLPSDERAWAGGIDPDSINCNSCESLSSKGAYFAGEIIDGLGLPGGFHLNLTWATAYQAGSAMGLANC